MLCSPAATMHAANPSINSSGPEPRLTLKSQLDDLARVWPWVEALAAQVSFPADTQFAIQLCLEEALSNIMRHGYRGQPNQSITIACTVERAPAAGELVFTIEDHAPPFDPFAAAPVAAPASILRIRARGPGNPPDAQILQPPRLAATPQGNRLTLAFAIPPSAQSLSLSSSRSLGPLVPVLRTPCGIIASIRYARLASPCGRLGGVCVPTLSASCLCNFRGDLRRPRPRLHPWRVRLVRRARR